MNLPGRLSRTSLGDLLGTLYRAGVSGVLELVEAGGVAAGRAHRIYLSDGLVDRVETPLPAPRLGEVLTDQGVLPRESLADLARRLLGSSGKRAGQLLIDAQLATPEVVSRGLRHQLRLRLEALFGLAEAEIRFHVRRPDRRESSRPKPLTPREFLYGRGRARSRPRRAQPIEPQVRLQAYRTLGLSPLASGVEVRRAFRRLAAELHPDSHPHGSTEERGLLLKRFAELSQAYHLIAG